VLFDVSIKSADGYQYLIQPTGLRVIPCPDLRVIPCPDLILWGCKREVILDIFGHETGAAIKASPAYKEEVKQGTPLTECMSITIS